MEFKPCNTLNKEILSFSDKDTVSNLGPLVHNVCKGDEQIDNQASSTTLKLEDSIHAPSVDRSQDLPKLFVGVLCSTFNSSEDQLENFIKGTLVNNGINYLKLEKVFYNGNNYMMVSLSD